MTIPYIILIIKGSKISFDFTNISVIYTSILQEISSIVATIKLKDKAFLKFQNINKARNNKKTPVQNKGLLK